MKHRPQAPQHCLDCDHGIRGGFPCKSCHGVGQELTTLERTLFERAERAETEIDRLRAMLDLAESALPDSTTAGPNGTGYKYAWDELDSDEQEWVKDIRHRMRGEP